MLEATAKNLVTSPCLLLAHPSAEFTGAIARQFRRLGWDTYSAGSGPEIRRLVRMLEADMVILHADLAGESGWLTCDKLTREQPLARVILVSDNLGPRHQELAAFVGASALIDAKTGLDRLIEEISGRVA